MAILSRTFIGLCLFLSVNSISVPVNQRISPPSDHNVGDTPNFHPQYSYAYNVQDINSGDSKTQHESRNGDVVHGGYSFMESDGSRRIVEYMADGIHGFNAIVRKQEGSGLHQGAVSSGSHAVSLPHIAPAPGYATIKGPIGMQQQHGGHHAQNIYQQRVMNIGIHHGQVPAYQSYGSDLHAGHQAPAIQSYTPRVINLPRPNLSFWPYAEAKVYYNHPNSIYPHAYLPKPFPQTHGFPFNGLPQTVHRHPTPLHPIPSNSYPAHPHPVNPYPINPSPVQPQPQNPPHVVPPKTVTIGRYGYGYAPLVNNQRH